MYWLPIISKNHPPEGQATVTNGARHAAGASGAPRSQDIEKVLNAAGAMVDALTPVRNKASLALPNKDLRGEGVEGEQIVLGLLEQLGHLRHRPF